MSVCSEGDQSDAWDTGASRTLSLSVVKVDWRKVFDSWKQDIPDH